MPGILYHLAFAEEVYSSLLPTHDINRSLFMSGNLIPDLATDKKASHYRQNSSSIVNFLVPDILQAKKELYSLDNPLFLGMYCHLYLDYQFIMNFLIPEFIWDTDKKLVINPRNKMQWDFETFFSSDGIYGSYTEINELLLRDGRVSMQTLTELPDALPLTGLSVFDTRYSRTWRQELNGYIAEQKAYTGNIFNYERLCNFIHQTAKKFVNEI
jgi:hypothetical protein